MDLRKAMLRMNWNWKGREGSGRPWKAFFFFGNCLEEIPKSGRAEQSRQTGVWVQTKRLTADSLPDTVGLPTQMKPPPRS